MDVSLKAVNHQQVDDEISRLVPFNLQAEQALLGAVLINNEALDRVSDLIGAVHFYDGLHAQIFTVMARLISAGRRADPITLRDHFQGQTINDDLTVPQYLGRLMANATTVKNARDYAQTILDLSTRRALIVVGERLIASAFDGHTHASPSEMIEEAESDLGKVAEVGTLGEAVALGDVIDDVLVAAAEAHRTGNVQLGLMTGFVDLDRLLGGLQPSNLYILGGRPSMGKTALAVQIGYKIAKRALAERLAAAEGKKLKYRGGKVGFMSLEMGRAQIGLRALALKTEVPTNVIRCGCNGDINKMEMVLRAGAELKSIPFYIDETGGLSINRLAAKARRMKRKHGLDLLIVDYLQLMTGNGSRDGNRVQEITEITTGLKTLAKDLNIPILALSQLSRKVEDRADKRPQLADLRESGSIEQDADVVLFVYRDEYYVGRENPGENDPKFTQWQARLSAATGKAEVIAAKQREGALGTVEMAWEGHLTRFTDMAQRSTR